MNGKIPIRILAQLLPARGLSTTKITARIRNPYRGMTQTIEVKTFLLEYVDDLPLFYIYKKRRLLCVFLSDLCIFLYLHVLIKNSSGIPALG